jgi:polyisoprenoid-binding protein YceI
MDESKSIDEHFRRKAMNQLPTLYLLILPFLVAPSALGQHQTFTIDSQSSTVAFSLGDVLHSVHGVFHVQSGAVDFDPAAPQISGSVVVAADSGHSGNDTRDRKMAKDILDAPHFAEVSFVPHSYQGSISPNGDSTIQVTGAFTLHGNPHELTVPIQIHTDGKNCTAKAHLGVPYVKWGLKDPSNFILRIAKKVDVEITLVGTLSRAN